MSTGWSDLLSVLTLSASLNYGFGAFTQIREIIFKPERGSLRLSFERTSALDASSEKQSISDSLRVIEQRLDQVEEQDFNRSTIVVLFTLICGSGAVALAIYGAYVSGEPTRDHRLWALATNLGWLTYLIINIVSFLTLRFSVDNPRRICDRRIARLEDVAQNS